MGNYDLIDKRNIDRDKEKRKDRFESVANYNFAPSPNRFILILSSLFICDCTLIADINITNAGFI